VYEAHFGLTTRPFAETVSATAYVPLPSRDAVLRRLRYALEHGDGPAVLYGTTGAGKTILARRLVMEMPGTAVHIGFPSLPAADLLTYIALEFGCPPAPPPPLHAAVRHLRNQWSALAARKERPLLILDEAHLIKDVTSFEALRLLLNFCTDGVADARLLLIGSAELLLELPSALGDRLAARCLLGPMSQAESSSYVLARIACAGKTTPLFTPEALVELHRAALGLPRRINRLADLALLIAYAQDHIVVDDLTVNLAARELEPGASAA
jgi:type II secretory pathway predicted ATPase ExeA